MERLTTDFLSVLNASVDTSSSVLQNMVWSIARYPHVQERLRLEVARVVGDGPITAEALAEMHYLKAVNREQHRLHWAAQGTVRIEGHDVVLKNGMHIPAGSLIAFGQEPFQMDPAMVNGDPQLFLPERWLDREGKFDRGRLGREREMDTGESAKVTDSGSSPDPGEKLGRVADYRDTVASGPGAKRSVDVLAPSAKLKHPLMMTPFGVGPRQCIGGRLATTEIAIAVADVVRNFDLLPPSPKSKHALVGTFGLPWPDPEIQFVSRWVLTKEDVKGELEYAAAHAHGHAHGHGHGDASKCPVMSSPRA